MWSRRWWRRCRLDGVYSIQGLQLWITILKNLVVLQCARVEPTSRAIHSEPVAPVQPVQIIVMVSYHRRRAYRFHRVAPRRRR